MLVIFCLVNLGNTIYDGSRNIYSFVFENLKIVLLPSPPAPPSSVTVPPLVEVSRLASAPVLFCSCLEFEQKLRDAGCVWALVASSRTVAQGDKLQPCFADLLADFVDVFLAELPKDLPPLHDIQHQIDLVREASLPNRSHYRMSPQEHEELCRQIKELIARGHIQ